MNTNKRNTEREESTYSLLVRSQDKKRTLAEGIVYSLIALGAIAAIWEFGQEFFWYNT
jgi:hypothetical protein